jgi:hypothetical protein
MHLSAWVAFGITLSLGGCLPGSENWCAYGEPECDQPAPTDSHCEGAMSCDADGRVSCSTDGSSYVVDDCAAEPTPRTCVEGGLEIPFCAVSPEPDERCQSDPGLTFCDHGVLTVCREGFLEQTQVCPGGACIEHEPQRTFCALSTERDPRCANEGAALDRTFCADDWIIDCFDGYAVLFHDCSPQQCSDSPNGQHAFCF